MIDAKEEQVESSRKSFDSDTGTLNYGSVEESPCSHFLFEFLIKRSGNVRISSDSDYFFSGLLLVFSVSFAVYCSLPLENFVEKVPYKRAVRNTHRKSLSKKDRIKMPVKDVQHESASLNTVKKPFSKTNRIENVVRKVSNKSAAHITVNKSPLRKDRIELLDEKFSYKSAAQNTVKTLLTKNTVSNSALKVYRTNVLPETPLNNCFQKTPCRILHRKSTVQTCCPQHR